MSESEQYPSHQHRGNSYDRIFGGYDKAVSQTQEGAADVAVANGTGVLRSEPAGRRRRWARTRTSHLSTLSLEGEPADDKEAPSALLASIEGAGSRASAAAAGPPEPPTPAFVANLGATPTCGRYAYRRQDGNPVTGEGYGRLESLSLQAFVKKK